MGKRAYDSDGKGISHRSSITNIVKVLISIIILFFAYIFRNQISVGLMVQAIGLLIFIIGCAFAALGGITLGEHFTLSHHPKSLVTKGIYSKIRHPMDFGGILLSYGFALYFQSLYGLILTIVLVAPLHIYAIIIEERIMIEKFGDEFKNYRKRTIF